jgi:antiviral helicase SKI2
MFGNDGIATGDVVLNAEEAFCIVMTTEVLRGMLYRQDEKLADVEFVIFDEMHYINDSKRGAVWEECIMMLPAHIRLILLSATVPNYMELARWIGKKREKTVYVQYTSKRPVPLCHSIYFDGLEIPLMTSASNQKGF